MKKTIIIFAVFAIVFIGFIPFIKGPIVCPFVPPCYTSKLSLVEWVRFKDNLKTTSENIVYTNSDYNFQLTLNSAWSGYKVDLETMSSNFGAGSLVFRVPTKSKNYSDGSGFANPLTISILQPEYWDKIQKNDGLKPWFLGKSRDGWVFVYYIWQDPPTDLVNVNLGINDVVRSFKFTK